MVLILTHISLTQLRRQHDGLASWQQHRSAPWFSHPRLGGDHANLALSNFVLLPAAAFASMQYILTYGGRCKENAQGTTVHVRS